MNEKISFEPTMTENEDEGRAKFTLDYRGDTSYFNIPRVTFDKICQIADSRKVKIDDLLRTGLDKYGFDQVMEKIIAEANSTPQNEQ